MVPTLPSGARVTAWRRWRRLREGDVVLTRDPRSPHRWIVKRCTAIVGGEVTLRGDNESKSTDSRTFGSVPERSVRWIVHVPRERPRS